MKSIRLGFRNLWKNKSTSIVNILGLTIALTSSVFIFMWVYNEVTFDKYQKNYKNIYLVASEWKYADGKTDFIMETPTPLSPFLKDNFPEVVQSTRFAKQFGGRYLESGDKKFREQGLAIEPSFFDIFTVDFIRGNPKIFEENPNSILISQRLADKFFGNQDPANQTITFFVNSEKTKQYEICGIYKDIPENSSIQFDFLIPAVINPKDSWFAFGYSTFVLLPGIIDKAQLNEKITQFYNKEKLGFDLNFYFHPLRNMHFHSDFQMFVYHPGDIQYVYIFSITGIFILLMAIINFMSLIGVLSSNRMKESGIRKISGAPKSKIALSFIVEPIILISVALVFTVIVVETFRPLLNSFSGSILPALHQNIPVLLVLILCFLLVGILAGIIPGIVTAGIKPIEALKQQKILNNRRSRKYLIAIQFTLAIVLLCSTFLINKQLNYIFQKDLGFQKENIIHVPLKGEINGKYEVIKQDLLSNPLITSVSHSTPLLSSGIESSGWNWEGNSPDQKNSVARIQADDDFLKTFGIELVQGNYFSEESSNDNKVVINEEAAKVMNMPNPIHKHLQLKGKDYEIIGVVNNFHSRHFNHLIRPLIISYANDGSNLFVRHKNSEDKTSVINYINKICEKFNPDFTFEYHFFADEFISIYGNERKMLELLSYFASVAFLILSFGLYALSKQIALSKTKEIGIRKVNGAKVAEILGMLNKDFIKWVIVSFIIACPTAYYAMNKWIENFAYKTTLSWWIFALAGVLALGIALLTVSWQGWRAATRNPVEALRYE